MGCSSTPCTPRRPALSHLPICGTRATPPDSTLTTNENDPGRGPLCLQTRMMGIPAVSCRLRGREEEATAVLGFLALPRPIAG